MNLKTTINISKNTVEISSIPNEYSTFFSACTRSRDKTKPVNLRREVQLNKRGWAWLFIGASSQDQGESCVWRPAHAWLARSSIIGQPVSLFFTRQIPPAELHATRSLASYAIFEINYLSLVSHDLFDILYVSLWFHCFYSAF